MTAQGKDLRGGGECRGRQRRRWQRQQQQLVVDKAELEKDQSMLDYSQIIAPFDGVVTQRFADTGAMVAAGTSSEKQALPVLELAQNNVLRLDIPVPESVVPSIREGDSVQVHVGALNSDFEGKVVRFSRQLDASTRTMITEIDVPNPKLTLVPGMYADVKIRLQHQQSVLCIADRIDCARRWKAVRAGGGRNESRGEARDRVGHRRSAAGGSLVRAARRGNGGGGEPGGVEAGAAGEAKAGCARGWRPEPGRRELMPTFAIKHPFFILVLCLMIARGRRGDGMCACPWIFSRTINIPVVVVATFYSGMPPQQIESDITDSYERFFTLGSGIDHIESRSLPGVSLIKIYFPPGTDPNAAVSNISNLAMANLRRLPPGTLPPVVLKFDASSLPVCLVTLKGEGLNETQLEGSGAIHGAQSDRQCAGRIGAAAVWRAATGRSWSTWTR